jgi:hypothetical protein
MEPGGLERVPQWQGLTVPTLQPVCDNSARRQKMLGPPTYRQTPDKPRNFRLLVTRY